ncbi:CLUMA_CG021253, isoform A [Clunio marinus]|uniref:CLUMA_CG021253, isoform A n=1 Tax=Clunio marinus TaxID=568069 RepID=A0A1J1J953_9DIPT|nr:CLUMA_CG021253, isoform A [Clunio marinus]
MEQKNNSSSDEELDVQSEKFNPLKALYAKRIKLPCKNVKKLDNVSSFLSRVQRAGNVLDSDLNVVPNKTKKDQETEAVDTQKYHITAHGRKFLKEQAPIHRGKSSKFTRNIFSRMEQCKGPLELLKKFRNNKTKVIIYIRKEHGIRGTITGFINAFDKHLNIALVDCIEIWKRRKFNFSENKVLLGQPEDCSKLLNLMGIKVPEITTKSINRKTVECTRKIPQLMIRGEDVVLVAAKDEKGTNDSIKS